MKDLNDFVMAAVSYNALAQVSSMAYGHRDLGLTDAEYAMLEELCDKALANLNDAFKEER